MSTSFFHGGVAVEEEVGADVFQSAKNVLKFAFDVDEDSFGELEFRTAPSLMSRSEAELLGVSLPRDAVVHSILAAKKLIDAAGVFEP